LRAAQILVRSGADVSAKNGWGDTPLIIASTPRYCGPDHPVVAYLRERASRAHPR
jgi:ankyrin repeat protein